MVYGGSDNNNTHAPVTLIDYYLFDPFGGFGTNPLADTLVSRSRTKNNVYIKLFKYYPLEANILLYGALTINDEIKNSFRKVDLQNLKNIYGYTPPDSIPNVQQLISLDSKNLDNASVFKNWHKNFQNVVSNDPNFFFEEVTNNIKSPQGNENLTFNRYGLKPINKLGALEYSNSILAFSPYALESVLSSAEKYKYYFPMHFELNFTANLFTDIGDSMRDFRMSKDIMKKIATIQKPYGLYQGQAGFSFSSDFTISNFVDYSQKKVYQNTQPDSQVLNLPILNDDSPYVSNYKKSFDFVKLINKILDDNGTEDSQKLTTAGYNYPVELAFLGVQAGVPSQHHELFEDPPINWYKDSRNYFSYIRDDASEPADIDSDLNQIVKSLYGPLFKEQIKNKYEQVKRSYKDIIDGKPAYTEDLFYVIKKFRTTDLGEANVQNIIIPNTSDLDIVKYIDTQIKYGTDATYQYDVFCYRLVFGSKYRYSFIQAAEEPTGLPSGESDGTENLAQPIDTLINSEGSEANLINGFLLQNLPAGVGGWSVGLDDYPENENLDLRPQLMLMCIRQYNFWKIRFFQLLL